MAIPNLLLDNSGIPIPQVLDTSTNTFKAYTTRVVRDAFAGNTNVTKSYATDMKAISVSNDGTNDVKIIVNSLTITIKATETFDEEFAPFTSFQIQATTDYRCIVKG